MESLMTYRAEFPDFDPATLPAIPAGWTDQSWHNDACPSFNAGNGMVVFIDFADASLKEFEDTKRFTVHADPEIHDSNDVLFETDEWNECLAFLIAKKWCTKIGMGFHPDTGGLDYDPPLSPNDVEEYNADMDRLFEIAADPYASAVRAMGI
jgi:hypothetical protein